MLEYYFALRSALRARPQVRPYRTRCRHCRIFFLAHPRNRGRRDLGCPFGCREAYRRKRSTERSAEYYNTPAGKRKKKEQNDKRKRESKSDQTSKEPEHIAMAERLGEVEHAARMLEAVQESGRKGETPQENVIRDSSQQIDLDFVMVEHARQSDRERKEQEQDTSAERPNEIDLDAGMVEHVQVVTSLIEDRHVGREEVVEMLRRIVRQHGIGGERRVDYILRSLETKPP